MCPSNITGMHIFTVVRSRGQQPVERCRCGLERPDVPPDSWHIVANCPCQGDVANCDYWNARDDERWHERRIRYRKNAVTKAEFEYTVAEQRLREAERALFEERTTVSDRRLDVG